MHEFDLDRTGMLISVFAQRQKEEMLELGAKSIKKLCDLLSKLNPQKNPFDSIKFLLSFLANVDLKVKPHLVDFFYDYCLKYQTKINWNTILLEFDNTRFHYREEIIFSFCKMSEEIKDEVFALALCFYTYNGHTPTPKEIEMIRKIDAVK